MNARDALLSMTPTEQTLARACAVLDRGKQGIDQPKWMIDGGWLSALEDAGLAECSEARGWRLTPAGRALAKTFLRAGAIERARAS